MDRGPSQDELDDLGVKLCDLLPQQHPMELETRQLFELVRIHGLFYPSTPLDAKVLDEVRTAWYAEFCGRHC